MIHFTIHIEIARTPQEVFAYLADLENTPQWNPAIVRTRKASPGDTRVGTRYAQERSSPRPESESLTVAEFDPERRLTVVGHLASMPARVSYVLSPTDSGTSLTNTVELDPPGARGLVGRAFSRQISASVAENLGRLKARLEANAVVGGGAQSRRAVC